jgi:hypothetical protein
VYKYTITSKRTDGVKEDTISAGSVHYGQDWIRFYIEDKANRDLDPVFAVSAGDVVTIRRLAEATPYESVSARAGQPTRSTTNIPVPDPSWFTREELDREIKHLRELLEARIDTVARDVDKLHEIIDGLKPEKYEQTLMNTLFNRRKYRIIRDVHLADGETFETPFGTHEQHGYLLEEQDSDPLNRFCVNAATLHRAADEYKAVDIPRWWQSDQ